MKRKIIQMVMLFATAIGFAAMSARAGDLTVTIKEPFSAGSKSYPAGHYRVLADPDGDHINLRNLDRKTDDAIKFITRLAPREGHRGAVVFDKTDSGLYLSEIYIIGMDGFYFQAVPGKHKHLIVKEDEP